MRRLVARRLGGLEDTTPAMRQHRVVLAGALVAVLLLVTGTAVWWSRDRPAAPASVQAPPATRAPADPAALQRQLDGVVETGAPGVVALVRSGPQTWQGASGLGDLGAKRPEQDQVGLGQGIHPVGPDTQQLAVEYACRQRPPPAPAAS